MATWFFSFVIRAWGEEAGPIALECPEHRHYHVQAENILVEVLNATGRPCAPGEEGRVVVTDLHNFATPLVRLRTGACAVPGEPCAFAPGLPVLERIELGVFDADC